MLPTTSQLLSTMTGLEAKLRESGKAGSATPAVYAHVNAAVRKRVKGPTHRSVRVLLLENVHYLAAVLDPKGFDAQASFAADNIDRAFQVVTTYFLRSPEVFSLQQLKQLDDNQRSLMLRNQVTTHTALSGTFAPGAYAARRPGSAVVLRELLAADWDLWGWWTLFGGSTPELREIGKALAGMTPCTGAVERSFSTQKSIHSLVCNRLAHERVAKLMFVHTNLSLMGGADSHAHELGFLESVLVDGESWQGSSADEIDDRESAVAGTE